MFKIRIGVLALGCATTVMAASLAHAQQQTLTVMGYVGAFEENYVKAVVDPFRAAHPDIKVNYYGVTNSAAMLGLLRAQKNAPQVDAVIFDISVARIGRDEKLLQEVDEAKVPNLKDLHPIGRELGRFAPPLTYDTYALLYNTQNVKPAPDSWEALWNPAHNRKVVISAQGGGDIQAAALTIVANRLVGNDQFMKDIEPGIRKLIELAPLVQTWEPKPDGYTLVANGTADVAVGWNARGQFYHDQTQGKLSVAVTKEGTLAQVNTIGLVANAPNADAAQVFINYALSPEAQQSLAGIMAYAPTNARAKLPPEVAARIPLADPSQMERLIPVDWLEVATVRDRWANAWRRQIIPASR